MSTHRKTVLAAALWLATVAMSNSPSLAADFYQGKQITIVVGFTTEGGYDITARLFARYPYYAFSDAVTLVDFPRQQ
jgi:tripartite-type tricarboxylate transporter receptor subunit TctC